MVDKEGLQLIGVTIRLKGTDFGTTTDVNGEFKLFYPVRKHPVIIVSYIGMVTEEISLGDDASKDKARVIKLKEDAVMTDEVVITGYSNINKMCIRDRCGTNRIRTYFADRSIDGYYS